MYYDLFAPFPITEAPVKKKGDKGKAKAAAAEAEAAPTDCWAGLTSTERAQVARTVALQGHLGYTVIAHTVTVQQSNNVVPCPFGSPEARLLPYANLDPRFATTTASSSTQPTLVQVTRYHMRLEDGKVHPITAGNTIPLRNYDILSAYVGSDKALQLACTDLANPGPNQISIITVPLHERPYHFRLNRKQIKQAQRNGVVFEILYSAGLFPSRSVPPEVARRYRQNFMSNARELVRVTGGKGIIFSSGPGGAPEGLRGPLDIINLATILGVPANLAKDTVCNTPKMILLRAQARRTYKAVLSTPHIVDAPGAEPEPEAKKPKAVEAANGGGGDVAMVVEDMQKQPAETQPGKRGSSGDGPAKKKKKVKSK